MTQNHSGRNGNVNSRIDARYEIPAGGQAIHTVSSDPDRREQMNTRVSNHLGRDVVVAKDSLTFVGGDHQVHAGDMALAINDVVSASGPLKYRGLGAVVVPAQLRTVEDDLLSTQPCTLIYFAAPNIPAQVSTEHLDNAVVELGQTVVQSLRNRQ